METRPRLITWGVCLALILTLVFPLIAWAQPRASETIHRVRRGETLATIAARYHVSVAQLAAYNGLRNPNFVYVGQRLRIPPAHPQSTIPTPAVRIHIVRRGEYLALIAQRYGTTVWALMRANRLSNRNLLYVGQRLRIPSPATVASSPSPSPSPTSRVTLRFSTPTAQPTPPPASRPTASPTPKPTPSPTPAARPTPTTAATRVHVVKRGEFLASIARKYGVSVQALLAVNRLRNPNILYAGQRLNIPSGALASMPRPTPAVNSARRSRKSTIKAPTSGKWIEVNVTTQTLRAYEGNRVVLVTKVSTGLPRTPTVLGRFRIRTKLRSQTMAGPGYYLPNVPYVMYFYAGYALHGTYWHNNFGRPMSHGCVNMRTSEAKWIYNWAPVGTLVVVHR